MWQRIRDTRNEGMTYRKICSKNAKALAEEEFIVGLESGS